MTEQEYLDSELYSDVKREYIDGYVYQIAGVKVNHGRIASNIQGTFWQHLKSEPSEVYSAEVKLKVNHDYYYPDIMVECSGIQGDQNLIEKPVLIVEVLSKSTKQVDKTTKRQAYTGIMTLQEYVLVEQDCVEIEITRRRTGWQSEFYYLGDCITFEAISLTTAVEELYARVDNEDMRAWIEQKKLEQIAQDT